MNPVVIEKRDKKEEKSDFMTCAAENSLFLRNQRYFVLLEDIQFKLTFDDMRKLVDQTNTTRRLCSSLILSRVWSNEQKY